jgi:hypothetical protein
VKARHWYYWGRPGQKGFGFGLCGGGGGCWVGLIQEVQTEIGWNGECVSADRK